VTNKQNKITIHDIARKAGVSAGTVDRVIHNRPGVSDRTRKEILKFIRLLDYQPDILARALASKKSIRIAAIYPGLKSGKLFWNLPELGMEKAISELLHFGVQLEKFPFDLSDSKSFLNKAKKILKSNPDGIILAPGLLKEAKWLSKKCSDLNIPLIYINSKLNEEQYLSYIGQDSYASGKVAAGLINLILEKEKVVAVINVEQDPENQVHIKEREKGFIDFSVKEFAKSPENILTFTIVKASDKSISNELGKIFSRYQIDGVYITNSRAYRIAEWLNIQKEYRPILIGYDLIDENKNMLNMGLIKFLISQKPEEQGYISIMTLFNHLVLKRKVERNQFLPIDIITAENIPYYNI
jgi:LacI family transcriptional regulator